MQVKVGIDILSKTRFLESVASGKEAFLEKIFTPQELRSNTHEQLASMFCLKEAVHKTFELIPGSWHSIHLRRLENGKISCTISPDILSVSIVSLDTSISHEDEIIVAVTSAIVENK